MLDADDAPMVKRGDIHEDSPPAAAEAPAGSGSVGDALRRIMEKQAQDRADVRDREA